MNKRQSLELYDLVSGNLDFIDIVFYVEPSEKISDLTYEFFYQGRRLERFHEEDQDFLVDKKSGVKFLHPKIIPI